ncbi:acyltransferase [Roseiconus lacunae]|uniref:acyltransferase family protein n=1 Tax=Roseiconus lacunae TaxID=2605694 RepID=UPI001E429648|nr:acyltransferase [Roseiconus lacunae]MCD0458897.1 acyltransferase [Roseiconus lacunae]WRQ49210.1 acyltransferase [Stieleria sp. HD01]
MLNAIDRRTDRIVYLPALDGVRALAAMGVFCVHLQQNSSIDWSVGPISLQQLCINGRVGVAAFFLLTGYLLAAPLWGGKESSKGSDPALRHFWRRRMIKIIPLYYAVLIALTLLHFSQAGNIDWSDVLLHAMFAHNFSPSSLYSISEPMWALAVIVQYYLVFWISVSVWALCRQNSCALFWGFALLASAGWGVTLIVSTGFSAASSASMLIWEHSLPAHLPIFSLGAILAWFARGQIVSRRRIHLCDFLALCSVVTLVVLLGTPLAAQLEERVGRYGYPVIPGLLAVVIYAAVQDGWTKSIFSRRVLVAVGTISYAIYLIHLPVIKFTKRVLSELHFVDDVPLLLATVAFLLTSLISLGFVALVENPLRRLVVGRTRE